MIIAMALCSTQLTFGGPTTAGSSDAARYIAELSREQKEYFEQPYSRGQYIQEAINDLADVADECAEANWDGHGAAAISDETYRVAYRVLESLPTHLPVPTCGAEPDGHITFEWHRNPTRTLSVSVNAEGDLHYSALVGPSKTFGTEPFLGDFPPALADLVQRVVGA